MEPEKKLSEKERLEKRKKEIEQRIKKIEAREIQKAKNIDKQRKIIVGEAVIDHATTDNKFAKILAEVLKVAVTEPRNLAVISDLISNVATEEKAADDNHAEISNLTGNSSVKELTVEDKSST